MWRSLDQLTTCSCCTRGLARYKLASFFQSPFARIILLLFGCYKKFVLLLFCCNKYTYLSDCNMCIRYTYNSYHYCITLFHTSWLLHLLVSSSELEKSPVCLLHQMLPSSTLDAASS